VGLGFRFFINQFLTIRVELRDTIYNENGLPLDQLVAQPADGRVRVLDVLPHRLRGALT
jgi:hypothetical protein